MRSARTGLVCYRLDDAQAAFQAYFERCETKPLDLFAFGTLKIVTGAEVDGFRLMDEAIEQARSRGDSEFVSIHEVERDHWRDNLDEIRSRDMARVRSDFAPETC